MEDLDQAIQVNRFNKNPDVKAILIKLSKSGDRWIREAAINALNTLPTTGYNQSSCLSAGFPCARVTNIRILFSGGKEDSSARPGDVSGEWLCQ